ncbi:MAG TPA: metallophosphoesterase [Allocoleopsis sp.]
MISRDRETYQNCLKIAVWHHPIHSTGEDRITDAAFLDRLAVAGFRLFLHGHVHEAKTSNYRYDMNKDGRHLDPICAGTFGAPTKELVTATPWQYNLLQFAGHKLTFRTRCRRKENGTWEPDSIWRQVGGKARRISTQLNCEVRFPQPSLNRLLRTHKSSGLCLR